MVKQHFLGCSQLPQQDRTHEDGIMKFRGLVIVDGNNKVIGRFEEGSGDESKPSTSGSGADNHDEEAVPEIRIKVEGKFPTEFARDTCATSSEGPKKRKGSRNGEATNNVEYKLQAAQTCNLNIEQFAKHHGQDTYQHIMHMLSLMKTMGMVYDNLAK